MVLRRFIDFHLIKSYSIMAIEPMVWMDMLCDGRAAYLADNISIAIANGKSGWLIT